MSNTVVAIINWNSGDMLRTCIESIIATTADVKILVIDNGSRDSSIDCVPDFGGRAQLIAHSDNRGFAAAANIAFGWTSTPYILILNPDIQVLPGTIQLLEEFMDEHPRAGAAGGYAGRKYLPRPFPTTGSLILENLGLANWTGAVPTEATEVDQLAAAAIMIRRDAYEDTSGFDERFYPAWYEDVDFCRRLQWCGWRSFFVPAAEFVHAGGYSTKALGEAKFLRAYYGNQILYARKHFGRMNAILVRASIAAGMVGRIICRPRHASGYAMAFFEALKIP